MVENNILELKNICFSYKESNEILKNINIKFKSGEITALLGTNGCGKTTLFKILTNIYKPNKGKIIYNNEEIKQENILEFKSLIGFMPEILQLYKNMSVRNVLSLLADLKGYKNTTNVDEILNSVFLLEHQNKKVKALSKGMKQRLNLAQAIIGNPKIILFDEPSNGFDCSSIIMFYKTLRNLVKNGAIALLSSHHLSEVYGNVDRVLILSNGNIIKDIEIDNINKNEEFIFKEITIYLTQKINERDYTKIKKIFCNLNLEKDFILNGKFDVNEIINLINELINLNIKIKDIRIDNKILEDILNKLS